MASTKPATVETILARYAADIAFVAEEPVATTLVDFTNQLRSAAVGFYLAGITGFEEVEAAANYLDDVNSSTDATEKAVFLKRAVKSLAHVDDMADEFRLMV